MTPSIEGTVPLAQDYRGPGTCLPAGSRLGLRASFLRGFLSFILSKIFAGPRTSTWGRPGLTSPIKWTQVCSLAVSITCVFVTAPSKTATYSATSVVFVAEKLFQGSRILWGNQHTLPHRQGRRHRNRLASPNIRVLHPPTPVSLITIPELTPDGTSFSGYPVVTFPADLHQESPFCC